MKFILDVFVAFVKHFVIGKHLITFWYASNECKKQNCHQKHHQFFYCCVVHIYIVINVNCWISPMKAPEIITQMPFGHFKRNVYKSVCLTGNITFHESKKNIFKDRGRIKWHGGWAFSADQSHPPYALRRNLGKILSML